MQNTSIRQFAYDTLKSPGSLLMTAMAVLNSETHPVISAFYAAGLVTQTCLRRVSREGAAFGYPALKFIAGKQGALATNAAITLGVSAATFLIGGPLLAGANLTFGLANMGQALIWGGKIPFKSPIARNFALTACEVGMIGGFLAIGTLVGLGTGALLTIAGVGGTLALVRSFAPNALHPYLLYADMLLTGALTGGQAALAQNPDYIIAASRVLAMGGIARLAVERARGDGWPPLSAYIPQARDVIRSGGRRVQSRALARLDRWRAGFVVLGGMQKRAVKKLQSGIAVREAQKAVLGACRPRSEWAAMIRRSHSQRPRSLAHRFRVRAAPVLARGDVVRVTARDRIGCRPIRHYPGGVAVGRRTSLCCREFDGLYGPLRRSLAQPS